MTTEDKELFIRLDTKMDQVLETLKLLPKMDERISCLEKNDGIKSEQIATNKSEIDKLRTQNSNWNLANTIAVIVSAVLGISIK